MSILRCIAYAAAISSASAFVTPPSMAVRSMVLAPSASPTMAFGAARPAPAGKKGGRKVAAKKVAPKKAQRFGGGRKAAKSSGGSYTFFSPTEKSGKLLQ